MVPFRLALMALLGFYWTGAYATNPRSAYCKTHPVRFTAQPYVIGVNRVKARVDLLVDWLDLVENKECAHGYYVRWTSLTAAAILDDVYWACTYDTNPDCGKEDVERFGREINQQTKQRLGTYQLIPDRPFFSHYNISVVAVAGQKLIESPPTEFCGTGRC